MSTRAASTGGGTATSPLAQRNTVTGLDAEKAASLSLREAEPLKRGAEGERVHYHAAASVTHAAFQVLWARIALITRLYLSP